MSEFILPIPGEYFYYKTFRYRFVSLIGWNENTGLMRCKVKDLSDGLTKPITVDSAYYQKDKNQNA